MSPCDYATPLAAPLVGDVAASIPVPRRLVNTDQALLTLASAWIVVQSTGWFRCERWTAEGRTDEFRIPALIDSIPTAVRLLLFGAVALALLQLQNR